MKQFEIVYITEKNQPQYPRNLCWTFPLGTDINEVYRKKLGWTDYQNSLSMGNITYIVQEKENNNGTI